MLKNALWVLFTIVVTILVFLALFASIMCILGESPFEWSAGGQAGAESPILVAPTACALLVVTPIFRA